MVSKPINKIINEGYSISVYPNNIFHLKFDGKSKIDLEKTKEIRNIGLELSKGEKFKTLLDFTGVLGVTTLDARQFMSKNENFNNLKICDAFIADSYTTSFLIGIYINLFSPKTPTKSFSTLEEAFKWASSFN